MNACGGWERDASRSEGFIARTRFDLDSAWTKALAFGGGPVGLRAAGIGPPGPGRAAPCQSNPPPEPECALESPEPVFSCAERVARMDAGHWRRLGDEGAAVLRALWDGGPGTLGDVLHRARREGHMWPLYRLMQGLTTLVASGLVDAG